MGAIGKILLQSIDGDTPSKSPRPMILYASTAPMFQGNSTWVCPSCACAANAQFCASCGEQRPDPNDLRFGAAFKQLFDVITDLDGPVVRSYRALLLRPGEMTHAYLVGRRRPYMNAFRLFLITNVIFFFVQTLSGLSIFSMPLDKHLDGQFYSDMATQLVTARVEAAHTTLDAYRPLFERAEQQYAKALVILMVPILALAAWLGAPRKFPGVGHMYFALHFYSFVMVYLSALFLLLAVVLIALARLGLAMSWSSVDEIVTGLELAGCALYLFLSAGRVYEIAVPRRLLMTGLMIVALPIALYGYRLAVFLIGLWTT
jgi:Protein of unknown function (DUF3667)